MSTITLLSFMKTCRHSCSVAQKKTINAPCLIRKQVSEPRPYGASSASPRWVGQVLNAASSAVSAKAPRSSAPGRSSRKRGLLHRDFPCPTTTHETQASLHDRWREESSWHQRVRLKHFAVARDLAVAILCL